TFAVPRRRSVRLCCRGAPDDAGFRRRFEHAVGAAAQPDPAIGARAGRQGHFGHHHRHHRPDPRLRRDRRRLPPPDPDRLWTLDPVRRQFVLPALLPIRRRSPGMIARAGPVAGYYAPVHRALTEPILLGGAPRAVAIVNGTLAAAIGLGLRLWIAGGI